MKDEQPDKGSTEFSEIWKFIEKKKIKIEIPPFIKFVLKFCGYENFYTISAIEENDFEYFENQVRKGGIIEFYQGEVAAEDVLKGSTKDVNNFEILRGHRKLLLAVINVVKERLEENGPENFFAPSPIRKKKTKVSAGTKTVKKQENEVPRKKQKFSSSELLGKSEQDYQNGPNAVTDIEHHKNVLLLKALTCLKVHNAGAYEEVKLNFPLAFALMHM